MNWEKFKALSLRKKAEHIWEYYRWHILVTVLILSMVISIVHTATSYEAPVLSVQMINVNAASPNGESFQEFFEEAGYPFEEDSVIVSKNIQPGSPDPMVSLAATQLIFCVVAAEEVDLFFWDTREVQPTLAEGVLLDLRDILPPDVLDAHQEKLCYAAHPETGEPYPCALYLEDNAWIRENEYYSACSVGVPHTVSDVEMASHFLMYLLDREN